VTKVLITGGAGFLGSHLARAMIRRGHTVDLVDDLSRGRVDDDLATLERSPSLRLLRLDLLRPGSLDGIDRDYEHVLHLAAVVGVAHVVRDPERTLRDNVLMTNHVLSWAAGLPRLARFLFASTSEVYAGTRQAFGVPIPTPERIPLAVSDIAEPRSAYALSKVYGEALCHHAGLPFTIVRPHNVYGPRMGLAHVIPELLERAHAASPGGVLEVHSIEHRRTFCFVDDAVEFILRMLSSDACAGETLNVGSAGPEVSIRELAELVVETVGRSLEVRGLVPTRGSPDRRCPDMTRAAQLTGWRAQTPLRSGVGRTYDWYRMRVFDREPVPVR
jgi:nucleoside-diphosphate-sugar epimerase